MRLLLAEDNARLCDLLAESLREAGHVVDAAPTGEAFEDMARAASYDLFILDLGLPDVDGLDLIRGVRARGVATPILIVSARSSVEERVVGLDSGADDFLVKPFSRAELLARVRALLRRPAGIASAVVSGGRVELDMGSFSVRCGGSDFHLRPSERRLLAVMLRRRGQIVPRPVIEEAVAGFDLETSPNSVEKLISRLRKALAETPSGLEIRTVRGMGYVLEERFEGRPRAQA